MNFHKKFYTFLASIMIACGVAIADSGEEIVIGPVEIHSSDRTISIGGETNDAIFDLSAQPIIDKFAESIDSITETRGYIKAKNVDDLLINDDLLWNIILDYTGYEPNRESNIDGKLFKFENRDSEVEYNIFTNEYFNGRTETNNITAFYPFYKVGAKYLNFGTTYPYGNMNRFGEVDQWTGPASNPPELPGNNTIPEALKIIPEVVGTEGTYSGLLCESFDPLVNATKFTIMAWVNRYGDDNNKAGRIIADLTGTTSGQGFQLRFAKKTVSGVTGSELLLYVNPGNSDYPCHSGGSGSEAEYIKDGNGNPILYPGENKWHHVAVSYDSNPNLEQNVKFYVDGKLITKSPYPKAFARGIIESNTTAVTIGCSSGGNTWEGEMIGYMDDLIVFKDWTPAYVAISDGRNGDVAFWMDMDDAILGKPNLTDVAVTFGQFDPHVTIYNADQVNKLINSGLTRDAAREIAREILEEGPTTFGQFDPKTEIYSADQIDLLKEAY